MLSEERKCTDSAITVFDSVFSSMRFDRKSQSGAIVRRAGLSTALDDESDTVSARSSFPASVLPTDRLFASPSPSGSLVRALGRTLSRLGWGWTNICCFRVCPSDDLTCNTFFSFDLQSSIEICLCLSR